MSKPSDASGGGGGVGGFLDAVDAWDKRVSYALYLGNSPAAAVAVPVCKLLEISGNGFFWLAAGMLALRFNPANSHAWVNLYVGLFIDLAVAGVVKGVFRRGRPEYSTNKNFTFAVDRFSFPSGHTMRVTYLACLCFRLAPHASLPPWLTPRALEAGVLAWSATVALSRVAFGRHHALDVVAGAVVGVLEYRLHATTPLWVGPAAAARWQAAAAAPILPRIAAGLGAEL